ncbi:MAG: hypothetical protein ABSA16_02035 [Thermoguttaceae bacterium]|jgi:hypothetical protein
MSKKPKHPKNRLKRLSLYPLKPEEALEAFIKVDAKKMEGKLKRINHKV